MVETLIDKCPRVETERLVLRKWQMSDLDGLIKLNTDPRVMEFFRKRPSAEESESALKRALQRQEEDGFCFPVVEDKQTGAFLGYCGLAIPAYGGPLPFDPCVEIGWQLIPETWGKGIAVEAANFWLGFGFETLQLNEVVAFTVVQNHKSRRVMEKLGMAYDPAEDFDFPGVPVEHPLCRHVLYRLSKKMYLECENG
ncbi:Protein N-acetyltransferase, RimJ/RimL family [Pseudovibrio denitrificans]|uniref:Protein N-acetyltransferase, RimJ/RimL family n=1 Tax=Pseudovibrio denitrificans TaxID=258256 RepID=A0A1I7ARA1_9HYPH|nr:GNAT family N-acetyltransferase [Pseudovibrio denitrificans]SFT77450.1 Protein N-acetyltransferase, RimJ/RimL family [Pseudovibrio denitrificans]